MFHSKLFFSVESRKTQDELESRIVDLCLEMKEKNGFDFEISFSDDE